MHGRGIPILGSQVHLGSQAVQDASADQSPLAYAAILPASSISAEHKHLLDFFALVMTSRVKSSIFSKYRDRSRSLEYHLLIHPMGFPVYDLRPGTYRSHVRARGSCSAILSPPAYAIGDSAAVVAGDWSVSSGLQAENTILSVSCFCCIGKRM